MDVSEPFQLDADDVRNACLKASDIGTWCVIESGSINLFANEKQARLAHQKFSKGVLVR